MKILYSQSCSLYQNSGASRWLRRMCENREEEVTSLVVNYNVAPIEKGKVKEIIIHIPFRQQKWMRWILRPFFAWLRDEVFFSYTKKRVQEAAAKIQYDVLHVINQGKYSEVLCNENLLVEKKIWASFHDHFSTTGRSFEDTKHLWIRADRRLVISNELGCEYQTIFGNKNFEIITDGLLKNEISIPKSIQHSKIVIYFAGLLHYDYYPLFKLLADTLDFLTNKDLTFKLKLRGVKNLSFLNSRKFEVEYLCDFVSDKELKAELDSADVLYLPIKFTDPKFYLYSLSTKMISYLGGSGTILYHGPADSAACNLLQKNNAAVLCNSLNIDEMIESIKNILKAGENISFHANELVTNNYDLINIQKRFWQEK